MCGCHRRYPPLCRRGHSDSVPCTSSCGNCSHLCHRTGHHGHRQPGSDGLRRWARCSMSCTKTVRRRRPRSPRTPWQPGRLRPCPTNRPKKLRGIPAFRRHHGPRPRPARSTCVRATCRRAHEAGTRDPARPRIDESTDQPCGHRRRQRWVTDPSPGRKSPERTIRGLRAYPALLPAVTKASGQPLDEGGC